MPENPISKENSVRYFNRKTLFIVLGAGIILSASIIRTAAQNQDAVAPAADLSLPMLELQLQRQLQVFGPGHPRVEALKQRIETARKPIEDARQAAAAKDLELNAVDDAELRRTVRMLVDRVKVLEYQVQRLRDPQPRVELLR